MANRKLAAFALETDTPGHGSSDPPKSFKAKPKAEPLDVRAVHDDTAAKFPKTIARLAE